MSFRFPFLVIILVWLANAASDAAEGQATLLKKLLISDTEAKAAQMIDDGRTDSFVAIKGVPMLEQSDFPATIAPFINKPITQELANAIAVAISQYARAHDRLIVKLTAPTPQDFLSTGVLRVAVIVGRYKDFQFRGNRWFSSKLLLDKLGIKPGDEVRVSKLEDAVNWANANPFRQIKVLVNDLADQPGKADLIVGVEERIPLRFTASYDDSGTPILGDHHYTGAVQFGNLWGIDHQGTYQFATTEHQGEFRSHSLDYRAPLPWRHYLQFSGGYLTVKPIFGANSPFSQTGKNINASLKYVFPIRGGDRPIEFTSGIDFKEGNNNFAYGGQPIPALSHTTDTFQWSNGVSTVRRDSLGAWLYAVNINASPGNINSRNNPDVYKDGRASTRTRYLTGNVSVQRLLNLSHNWSIFFRAVGQVTSGNIPGSEQISIGGSATVRGYNERVFTGDEGFVFSADLQAPAIKYAIPFLKKSPPLETRLVGFFDTAQVYYHTVQPGDIILPPLTSTGVGVRVNLPANFVMTADYGWQVKHPAFIGTGHSRGHVKVVLAF